MSDADNATTEARIPNLPREEWTDAARDVFAFWGEPNAREEGSGVNFVMAMATHPDLANGYNILGKHFLMSNTLAVRQLELLILRVAWNVKSEYEWHNHIGYALNAGITLEEIAALKEDVSAHDWDDLDAAVISAVDQIVAKGNIDDDLWARLSKHYDKKQMMDLIFSTGFYVMTSWGLSIMQVGMESPDPIGFDLKTKSGKTPGKTYKPGETEDWIETRDY